MSVSKREKIFSRIVTLAGLLILAGAITKLFAFVINITGTSLVTGGVNEVRDYVSFRMAYLITQGKNPYSMNMLSDGNVPFMCLYTVLMPLFVAGVTMITGMNIFEGYYFINILLIILTGYIMWLITKEYFKNYSILYALCILIIAPTFFVFLEIPFFNFHTDTIGIFLSSLIFLIVYKDKEKKKSIMLSFLTVLLLFTKQILVVMALPLLVYYLIYDKKRAFKYLWQCALIGVLTVLIVRIAFPLCWTEMIYAQFVSSGNYGSFGKALYNIVHLYYMYCPFVILIVIGIVSVIVYNVKKGQQSKIGTFLKNVVKEEEYGVYLFLNLIFGTISLLYFAKCGGDGIKYCHDIITPSLFLITVYVWCGYQSRNLNIKSDYDFIKNGYTIIALCIASVIVFSGFKYNRYDENDVNSQIALNNVIKEHSDGKIYVGMAATGYLVQNNLWESENVWFNDGQIEYFDYENDASSFMNNIFYVEETKKAARDYKNEVNRMIENKEFSVITTCLDELINMEILEDNYEIIGSYEIRTNAMMGTFTVTAWKPKE